MIRKTLSILAALPILASAQSIKQGYQYRVLLKGTTLVALEQQLQPLKMEVTGIQHWLAGQANQITLTITNTNDSPLSLNFNSGKVFDAKIVQGKQILWQWSEGRYFIQALSNKNIAAGESLSYQIEMPQLVKLNLTGEAQLVVDYLTRSQTKGTKDRFNIK